MNLLKKTMLNWIDFKYENYKKNKKKNYKKPTGKTKKKIVKKPTGKT